MVILKSSKIQTLQGLVDKLDKKIKETYEEYLDKLQEKLFKETGNHIRTLFLEHAEEYNIPTDAKERTKFIINLVRKEMPSSVRKEFNSDRKEKYRIEKEIEKLKNESAYRNRTIEQGKGRKGRDKSKGAKRREEEKARKERLRNLRRR
tara:strand:- start:721 stop:1167 length:447 start_codon:yes stop_codon:yes gene_type:complete